MQRQKKQKGKRTTSQQLINQIDKESSQSQRFLLKDCSILQQQAHSNQQSNQTVRIKSDNCQDLTKCELQNYSEIIPEPLSNQLENKINFKLDFSTQQGQPILEFTRPFKGGMPQRQPLNLKISKNSLTLDLENEIKCEFCGSTFKKWTSLGGHIAKKHRGKSLKSLQKTAVRQNRAVIRDTSHRIQAIINRQINDILHY